MKRQRCSTHGTVKARYIRQVKDRRVFVDVCKECAKESGRKGGLKRVGKA